MEGYQFKYVDGHYEVYSGREFIFSADTLMEAYHEISATQR